MNSHSGLSKMTKSRFLLLAIIIAAAVCIRLIPYVLGALGLTDVRQFAGFLWNFSPIMALYLFTGARFPERRWAYGAPLAAMLFSDVAIGLFLGDMRMGLHPMIPVIYGSYALIIWSGALLRKLQQRMMDQNRETQGRPLNQPILSGLLFLGAVAGAGIAGELAFFIVTNFANWVVQTGYYPHTLDGLMQCYVAGIPFFKNAVESTPLYGVVLFGCSALAEAWFPALKPGPVEIAKSEQALLA
jgi:hypothetical protein